MNALIEKINPLDAQKILEELQEIFKASLRQIQESFLPIEKRRAEKALIEAGIIPKEGIDATLSLDEKITLATTKLEAALAAIPTVAGLMKSDENHYQHEVEKMVQEAELAQKQKANNQSQN